ncbi:phage major capsid protein [Hydrogenophaga borbori]
METAELKTALDEFTSSATKKIDGALSSIDEIKSAMDEIQKKANRPQSGPVDDGERKMTPTELKAMNDALRLLIKGDEAAANAKFQESKAMSVGSDPDGGYLVIPQFTTNMTRVMAEISPMYRLARKIPIVGGHDSYEEPADIEQAEALWTGEQSSRGETTTPTLKMLHLSLDEIYAMPKVTQKLIDLSSINIMAWLEQKVGEAFAVKEGLAMHSGDGVAKPRGILTYNIATTKDATRPWGTVQYIPSGASGAFKTPTTSVSPADALIDMVTALKPQFRAGARWFMNRNTAGVMRKFKDADGRFIWVDSIIAGQPSTLLGYPVEEDEDMPDISADSLSVAFGNMERAYTVIEKPGIKFLPDPYTAKPHVLLYAYRRMSGGMHNSQAFKLMKFSTT